jgi:glycosyltransferase involved in cell wall biosynthesis
MMIPGREDEYFFFSVVIPAHNEEGYIDKTIISLKEEDYPREKLEVILVENGSEDKTNEIIMQTSPDWF